MKRVNFKFKSTALVLLALGLSSNLWGATEVTIDYSDLSGKGKSGGGTAINYSEGGVNFNSTSAYGNTSYVQLYSGGTLTISSSSTISSIVINCTGSGTANYSPSKISKKSRSPGSYSYSGKVGTWTGSGTSITFSMSAQVRMTSVVITISSTCTTAIDITKGTPTNGSFTLTGGGTDICIDEGNASVSLSNIAGSTHYHPTVVTVSGGGSPNIGTISAGSATVSNISADATINVTFVEDTKYIIQFTDGIHGQTVDSKQVYASETFDFPTITDRTEKTSGTCEEVHYHFMGWVISTHVGEITAGDIKTGTSEAVSAAATYKAVWAAKDTSK